ncbi:tetratricopeptide repeat protein [Larkinella sp.]|uniref:tetratricopeptide repeat protein n=1 Tax=Larkinella sp. TaxID=2034517 RepID=UPI003BAC73B6
MNELERIDDYFAGRLSPEDRDRFEATLPRNPALARSVAFYLLARQTARQETRRILQPLPVRRLPVRMLAAVAACLLLLLGWYLTVWQTSPSAREVADQYLSEHYDQLPVSLDGQSDSLKTGSQFYNMGEFRKAETVFETMLEREPAHPEALKRAGLVSLRLNKYDQAIERFQRLGRQTDLYANPGIFLEALARLKRGQPMDKNRTKKLLLTVIQGNLEGKKEAGQLVEKIKFN